MKLLTLEDLDDLERMALINISYSRLDTYEMCPSKYFYTYIKKEDRQFGPAATLGTIIHSVLEDHVGTELKYSDMLVSMDEHRKIEDPDFQIDNKLYESGKEMVYEFVERHKDESFDVVGKELPFEIVIGSALVRGFIDLVLRDANGQLMVVDYKSGRWEVTFKDAPNNLQIGIYALAVSQIFPGEDIYAELYYLRSGRRKGHLFKQEDMDEVYNRTLEKIQVIINDQNFKATQNSRPCSFCDFRKSGTCSTGVMRFGRD